MDNRTFEKIKLSRRDFLKASGAVSLATLASGSRGAFAASSQPFHFTVTGDPREGLRAFENVCREMQNKVGGVGAFHISAGDYYDDGTKAADFYNALRNQFGNDVLWYPTVGNHEEGTSDMGWIRNHFSRLDYVVKPGPPGAEKTTYSWEYGDVHIAQIDLYYGSWFNWLVEDLNNNTKPIVFVCYHEPQFPNGRGGKDNSPNMQFWNLLKEKKVVAGFCAHTHQYGRGRYGGNDITWEVDVGSAGRESHWDGKFRFVDVEINGGTVNFTTWSGSESGSFSITDSWTAEVEGVAPSADLNQDGVVNFLDLARLLRGMLG